MLRVLIFLLGVPWFGQLASSVLLAKVAVVAEGSPLNIRTDSYEARVEADGCLTNLRVNGREFLAPGVAISRGSYFFQGGPLKLQRMERPSENVILARGDVGSIRYEFGESEMTWRLANESDDPLVLFLVFAKDLEAAFGQNGKAIALPVNESWSEVAVTVGNARLKIQGCDKLWGPWQGPHQVCQVSLDPREEKSLKLSMGRVSVMEREQIKALVPRQTESKLQLFSPRNYQVFQRSSARQGAFVVSGQTTTEAKEIRARVTGSSLDGPLPGQWQPIPFNHETRSFSAVLALPAGGWYALHLEALDQGEVLAELKVERFGIGEVFVGAGQSNSTNSGEIRTQQKTGKVASFSGQEWQLADDPQPGVADRSQGGSFWPAFGDAMYERFGVPIGVATTGFGGTSVNQWQPDGDLFPWTMTRIHQLGPFGFRALLWHQGESDVEMPSDEYYDKLRNIIQASRRQAGWYIPWFIAQASYHNPEKPRFETVRTAQSRLWKSGFALQGPDTDTLTGDRRDLNGAGIHFSPKGLHEHGRMWADLVGDYLDTLLESEDGDAAESGLRATASVWPEASEMFHRDPRWLGGDDAYSLDLGDGRVAWFFGDSFVAPKVAGQRRGTTMVHNSVGIQIGYDPTTAKFTTYWRSTEGKPTSFFPDDGKHYFWPGGSILVEGKLLVFFMQSWTKDPTSAMGFDTDGWAATMIDNPRDSPDRWRLRRLEAPQNSFDVLVGSASLVRDGDYLVAFSVGNKEHPVFLIRFPWRGAAVGDLSQPEWWSGAERGWAAQSELTERPAPIIEGGQTEFSVIHSPSLETYLQFQFAGFPVSPIGLRTSLELTGPWSQLTPFLEPDELTALIPGLMLYAVKAHPEQECDGLALTYASNTHKLEQLLDSATIYYPEFLRVKLERPVR